MNFGFVLGAGILLVEAGRLVKGKRELRELSQRSGGRFPDGMIRNFGVTESHFSLENENVSKEIGFWIGRRKGFV